MANATSPVPQVVEGSGAVAKLNQLIDAMSQGLLGGRNWATSALLTWGYLGARVAGINVANGTVTLTASTTNYVVMARATGVVSVSTATANWNDATNYWRLYSVITSATTWTDYTDERFSAAGPFPLGGTLFTGGTMASALNEAPAVSIASAATVAIGAAAANTVNITGTTTITAFDTIAASAVRRVIFGGILTLTHNGTSLILPTGASIATAAGDVAEFVSLGAGNWQCVHYMRASGNSLSGSAFTGGTLTGALNEATPATVASAATTNIGAAASNTVNVSGTTTITAFDTIAAGAYRRVVFAGALTLTYNATSLILPTSANITTAAGDMAEFISLGSGNWQCVAYSRKNGASLFDRNGVAVLSISSGVVNIDCSLGDYFTLALTANVTSITFSNLPASGKGASLMLRITQDPTTARTVAWPASFRWDSTGSVPVSSALSAVDVLAITSFDQGTKWDATISKGRA